MRVVDAGVVVEVLTGASTVSALGHEPLAAPHLLDSEVMNVLRNLERRHAVTAVESTTRVAAFEALQIRRFPAAPLRRRIWELRHSVSAYDATYIALAESLKVTEFLTTDARLARAIGPRCTIRVL
ncbi:MAG: type II toxin-antitoxin system VapC family toxin [Galactobacter sp.]